jgi:hypothetical protein
LTQVFATRIRLRWFFIAFLPILSYNRRTLNKHIYVTRSLSDNKKQRDGRGIQHSKEQEEQKRYPKKVGAQKVFQKTPKARSFQRSKEIIQIKMHPLGCILICLNSPHTDISNYSRIYQYRKMNRKQMSDTKGVTHLF